MAPSTDGATMKKFIVTAMASVSFVVEAETQTEARDRIKSWYYAFDIGTDPWHGVEDSGGTLSEITQVEELT
jgi:hypothetical protein